MVAGSSRRHFKLRIAVLALVLLFAVLIVWAWIYASRTPLARGEKLVSLVTIDADLVATCPSGAELWREFAALPGYQSFASSADGKAFLSADAAARAVQAVNEHGRVLGIQLLDAAGLFGGEVVLARPSSGPPGSFLCLSRLPAKTNLLLGLYTLAATTQPLPEPAKDGWAIAVPGTALRWTKIGDVAAISNDPRLLARFVASARAAKHTPDPLAALLASGEGTQIAARLPHAPPAMPGAIPSDCVVTLCFGPASAEQHSPRPFPSRESNDADQRGSRTHALSHPSPSQGEGRGRVEADAAEASPFYAVAAGYIPGDARGALALSVAAPTLWQMWLQTLPAPEREKTVRFAEERVAARLVVDDFERDVLGRFTGDCAVAVSSKPDPWMTLASGRPAPAILVIVRLRADAALESRLPFALVELASVLLEADRSVQGNVLEQTEGSHGYHVLRVRRGGATADAALAVVPDDTAPGFSLLIASSSAEWLKRSLRARDKGEGSLARQSWFRSIRGAVPANDTVFGFLRGITPARTEAPGQPASAPPAAQTDASWLRLLETIVISGRLDKDNVFRLELRLGAVGPGPK